MQILVGISNSSLTDLAHSRVVLLCNSNCELTVLPQSTLLARNGSPSGQNNGEKKSQLVEKGSELVLSSKHDQLTISGPGLKLETREAVSIGTQTDRANHESSSSFTITSISRQRAKGNTNPHYVGGLVAFARGDSTRINLACDLENYVRGVLQSEVPESYHIEAIKAQAVAARTYGLHPRIDHSRDHANVCDSYLCCQYFAGSNFELSGKYKSAIDETENQILTFAGQPILALFSSNAGGFTEDYENCFSDNYSSPATNADSRHAEKFPGTSLPYLKGVPEGKLPGLAKDNGHSNEESLRLIFADKSIVTADSWSTQFRWQVNLSANQLESHMHHVIETMQNDQQFAPFIVAPQSGQFGHIKGFRISRRGVSATIMELEIATSMGNWLVKKELVIRSVFKNPDAKLQRLKSAKFFVDQKQDSLGLLSSIQISGMGWGHGVGMQQTGAQGMALSGRSYKQILAHYFQGAVIAKA
jgi:stage II sporulation protein D